MSTDRYNRQTLLSSFGTGGQRKLRESTAAIIGLGALGSHIAETLARKGIGKLILIDRDFVELNNLNRQSLYTEADASEKTPKAYAATERLTEINSEVKYSAILDHLGPGNIKRVLKDADILLDGTDNFITRYLLNDYSRFSGKPYVYCGVVGYQATCIPILPGEACLRCLFRDMPDPSVEPACDTAGVWPPAVAVISALAVDLALRWLVGATPENVWRTYFIDLSDGYLSSRSIAGMKSDTCPACAGNYEFMNSADPGPAHICGADAFQILGGEKQIDLGLVASKIGRAAITKQRKFFLEIEIPEGVTINLFNNGRAIIRGVSDAGRAQAIYDKYIGG